MASGSRGAKPPPAMTPSSAVKSIADFRLNIHEEFQGWILCFATVTAIFLMCLPCYCAGLSYAPARRFAAWLSQRLPSFYFCMTIFNFLFLVLITQWLPDWTFAQYLITMVKTLGGTMKHLVDCATSIAIIAAFCVVVAFKDRIAQLLGFDHKTLFRFKVRDCLSCMGPSRFRPIELSVWKVEDLKSADPFLANNVFVEFFLGYNEKVTTRVHNNAGSSCLLKEHLQLNFDEDDEEEILHVFVRNQKVMGTSELARQEIQADSLKRMVRSAKSYGEAVRWTDEYFSEPIMLIPRGKLWLRAAPVEDDDHRGSLIHELTAC